MNARNKEYIKWWESSIVLKKRKQFEGKENNLKVLPRIKDMNLWIERISQIGMKIFKNK